jgi:hypothetical protein
LFYTNYGTGASGVNVPIRMGDTVYYATDTPNTVNMTVATGATGAVVTINVTGPTGAGGTGSYIVRPGSGATGAASALDSLLNTLTFAVTGATGISGVTGGGLRIAVTTGPSGPVVTFDASALTQTVNNLMVTQTYAPNLGELNTGAFYNNKPVYRQAWRFPVTAGINAQDNHMLISQVGYVDSIVNSGGYMSTGNGAEKYNIPSTLRDYSTNWVAGYPLVNASNQLILSTVSSTNRVDADTFVWVDYTKV